VQRHVEQLLPQRTVVLTREPRNVGGAPWHTSCPVLTPAAPRSAWHRIVRSLEYARGMPPDAGRTRRFLSHHRVEAVMGEYLDFALCYLGLSRRIGAASMPTRTATTCRSCSATPAGARRTAA
jgi:hypothetical protein